MKIAVVGSRDYPWEHLVREFVRSLPVDWEIVSGGARGVDSWAVAEAKLGGHPFYEFKPKASGTAALFARNAEIAYDCDTMVAFTIGSNGTHDAIVRTGRLGKPVFVVAGGSGPPTVDQILAAIAAAPGR